MVWSSANALDFTVNHLTYHVNDGETTASLSGRDNEFAGQLNIPSSVTYQGNTYTVNRIGIEAFRNCYALTGSLVIPDNIILIEWHAFSGCSNLTGTLTLGNSLTTLEDNVFDGCNGLTGTLTIPSSLTTIGEFAFSHCSGFTGPLTIPSTVTHLGAGAFEYCSGFSSLYLNAHISEIDYNTFQECTGFSNTLVISSHVTSIGEDAFAGCTGFHGDLNVGSNVTDIKYRAFYNCSGFDGNITIGDRVTNIGDEAFHGCNGVTGNITIGNRVTTIGEKAFMGIPFNGTLTIGNSVTTIKTSAFALCQNCVAVVIKRTTPPSLGSNAFQYFNGLARLEVPLYCRSIYVSSSWHNIFGNIQERNIFSDDNFDYRLEDDNTVTVIGNWRGYAATGNLIIPASVSYLDHNFDIIRIGDYAFCNVRSMYGNVVIPNSILFIGNGAFAENNFEGTLTIGNSVLQIGDFAFDQCFGFTGSLTIPNSVIIIGDYAFSGCSKFTGLVFGESVSQIGYNAFDGFGYSGNISQVVSLAETAPSLESDAFTNMSCTSLRVPCGSTLSYESSAWAQHFTTIEEDCSSVETAVTNTTSVYPNPSTGVIRMESENMKNISIFNSLGQKVFETEASGDSFDYNFNGASGIYLIKVETINGVETKRVTVL